MRKGGTSKLTIFLLLLAGAFAGSGLWQLLSGVLPQALSQSFTIGSIAGPWSIDLFFLSLSFGIVMRANIGSIIGMIAALVICFRL